ncbi:MAG: NAD(P)H-binding protein [Pseudomonadota bacterium]
MHKRILVLGGRGFVGRHAVAALEALPGVEVSVGSREAGELPGIRLEAHRTPADWLTLIEPFDTVVNCVGILRPVGAASYDAVHHQAPAALASACKQLGKRLVHVSALGLSNSARSGFIRSKLAGEHAIAASDADWLIVRPSLLDGPGGFGAAWLRWVARLPIFFAPPAASGQIAALTVGDLGKALAVLSTAAADKLGAEESRFFELGGVTTADFQTYVRGLRRKQGFTKPAKAIPLPAWMARLGAHLCDLVHFSPFSFGHWELLQRDNLPQPNRLPQLLGRPPETVLPA